MTRNSIFSGAAVLAFSAITLAMPASAKATMHHHRHHAAATSDSSSEEQQTAQLNQQQLGNPGGMSSGNAMGANGMSNPSQSESMTHHDNGGQVNNANGANGNNTATAPH